WYPAGDAQLDTMNEKRLFGDRGEGVLINGRIGKTKSLITKRRDYRDVELHVEFMVAKGSNSGIIFHGNYEIQIMDSAHVKKPTGGHCGGIYPRAENLPKYHHIDKGSPPRVNAAKKPGEWQTMDIIFQSPRFDRNGKKTANARFVKVIHNGRVIQENVEVPYASGPNWNRKQHPQGPIIIQGDYGPIALRNVRVRDWEGEAGHLLNVPPEGFTALFNGKDLAGWRTPPLVREYWQVEDGILKSPGLIEGWGASLSTEKHYRDFILMFDFRMPTLSDSGINFRRLIPEIPGFGDMEQFNLRSKGGMGHLESYYFLPKETAKKMKLKEEEKPHVRNIDPEVGVWHTVKLTMQGRTFSAEYDSELIHDNFKYHDWMIDMEPAPIRLQKHSVVYGENLGVTNACPIEYRNIFIKEIKPAPRRPAPKSVAGGGKRFWTSSDGSRTVEAEFIEDQGDTIILKRSNGKRVAIPLDQLSRKDNEWVIDWREEAVLAKAAKPSVSPKLGARFEDVSSVPSTPLPDGASPRPNVIILLADDLGYRDIGCYDGPVKTPVLDELAANGVRFTDFHSGCPVCSPSRAVALTGRHHIRAGVYNVIQHGVHNMHLLERETTLAEVLRDNGYATAHFGKWHLGMPDGKRDKPTPTEHGFDYWFGLVNGANPSHKDPVNFLRNGKPVGKMKGYSCQIVVDEAISWLQETDDPDAPFFLNIWFNEPHAPIAAPDEIVSHYGKLSDPAAIYSGTIENTDHAIAKLLKHLKAIGELDNTIVVYSSDNGSYRTDRVGKLRGKKGSNYEGGHRVPGIFYWKNGIPGGRVEDEPAGMVDWLPTICGLVGIEKPRGVHLDGSDLAPLLTRNGTFKRHQPLFWLRPEGGLAMMLREGDFTAAGYCDLKLPNNWKEINGLITQIGEVLGQDAWADDGSGGIRSAVFSGTFKNKEAARLQRQVKELNGFQESNIPAMKAGGIGRVELYDLSKDISQKTNVADRYPEVAGRMKEQMNAIYASVMADAPEWVSVEDAPARPVAEAAGSEMEELLARIDATGLPSGYSGSIHQKYVDRRMKKMTNEQRVRLRTLWKEKQRLDPDMPNRGASFVKILEHVASEEEAERGSD
ncbi:MAG: sulfatase-like hydrolase/transferase, partial [Kiritimatiellales bacterium]|nr:sulfatase-like hydrolase/transferase [Kiritimatiellales bacterium]